MTRHAQLWCSISIVAVLLLSGCQVQGGVGAGAGVSLGGKSAADKQHELQVACLTGGREWTGKKCVALKTQQ